MTKPVLRGTFKRSCRRCGWENSYSTKAQADYRKRRHSCDARIAKAARAQAYRERIDAIDRTPKPCSHPNTHHEHGTNACYVLDFCRCYPCSAARVEADRTRSRQQAYGRYDRYVDADGARAHIRSLMDQGMGLKRIVAVSDLSQGMLWKLMYGKRRPDGSKVPSKRILRTTEERVLSVELDLADGLPVDNTGTTRRLQALIALGWSASKLGTRLGILPTNMTPLIWGRRDVTVATAKAVRALYDELSMTFPPEDEWRDKIAASRSRAYARKNGWLPPLAWDNESLDDPNHASVLPQDRGLANSEAIDEAAIYRRMHGDRTVRLSKAESAELVRRWQAAGRSLAECERQTGIAVNRYRDREGAA